VSIVNKSSVVLLVFAILVLLFIPEIMAHAPLGSGDNESLATAATIPEPLKSWALYSQLHEGGEAQYYKFNITQGQRIHIMLYKSRRSEEATFSPSFVLMGASLVEQGTIPSYVQKPADAKLFEVQGQQAAAATYEPFSPSSFYSMADLTIDAPASGTYYIAVFEPTEGGHYGLAVGDSESYTIDEWILIPLNLLSIYQWEGQSLALILAPMIATLAIGVGFSMWKIGKRGTIMTWFGVLAGLLFVGTSISTLFQMIISVIGTSVGAEVVVTLVFALIPMILGLATLRLSSREEDKASMRKRIYLVVLGVIALFMWAGLLVGPALAIIASAMPVGRRKEK
jgi:hypothetical protein